MVLDEIRVAHSNDLKGVAALYKAICDHQPLDKYGADWTWGEYPSVDSLQKMIENATVMIGLKTGATILCFSSIHNLPISKLPLGDCLHLKYLC